MASVTTAAPAKTAPWWRNLSRLSQEQVVAAIIIVLLIVFAVALPGFATTQNILGLIRSISILGILGLGMGLIVISRSIDLSEIALMACPWGVARSRTSTGFPRFGRLCLAFGMAVAIGASTESWLLSSRPRRCSSRWRPLSSFMAPRTGLRRSTSSMSPQDAAALLFAGRGTLFGIPMPIFVFAGAALLMHAFLSRTSIGRFIYAQGDNPEAARLSGIALRPLIVLEHVLVAVFAWLAGLVWIGQTGSMQTNIVISRHADFRRDPRCRARRY